MTERKAEVKELQKAAEARLSFCGFCLSDKSICSGMVRLAVKQVAEKTVNIHGRHLRLLEGVWNALNA